MYAACLLGGIALWGLISLVHLFCSFCSCVCWFTTNTKLITVFYLIACALSRTNSGPPVLLLCRHKREGNDDRKNMAGLSVKAGYRPQVIETTVNHWRIRPQTTKDNRNCEKSRAQRPALSRAGPAASPRSSRLSCRFSSLPAPKPPGASTSRCPAGNGGSSPNTLRSDVPNGQ